MKSGKRPLSKKIISSPVTLAALLIVLIFIAKAAWNINRQVKASATHLADARGSLMSLKSRQSDLSGKVATLSTDEGVEAEIRSKYHAVKEGESVAVIVDDEATTSKDQASTTPQIGWFGKLLRSIGL